MSQFAIKAVNLGKRYKIGAKQEAYRTLRSTLTDVVTARFRRPKRLDDQQVRASSHTWALRDVSFQINRGEVVGIIGRNGAGKSTLLKMLSRITEPTTGYADIQGRVGSLLEVGTGFHPELTGRENIYLNGAILGMKRAEMKQKFGELVAFAEIDKFIDTPVKHYSSGMYLRLAFAVAAYLEPDILLVDEVLSVGDAAFQRKCLGRMGEIVEKGRTVLLVSHNMTAIQNLCEKVLVLEDGLIKYIGQAREGIKQYLDTTGEEGKGSWDLTTHQRRRKGCTPLLKSIQLMDSSGNVRERFCSCEKMRIELTVDPSVQLADPQFGIGVDDWLGTRIFSVASYLSSSKLPALKERCTIVCEINEVPLIPGRYSLSLSLGSAYDSLIDALDQAVWFEIEGADVFGNGRMPGPALGKVLVRSHWEKL